MQSPLEVEAKKGSQSNRGKAKKNTIYSVEANRKGTAATKHATDSGKIIP